MLERTYVMCLTAGLALLTPLSAATAAETKTTDQVDTAQTPDAPDPTEEATPVENTDAILAKVTIDFQMLGYHSIAYPPLTVHFDEEGEVIVEKDEVNHTFKAEVSRADKPGKAVVALSYTRGAEAVFTRTVTVELDGKLKKYKNAGKIYSLQVSNVVPEKIDMPEEDDDPLAGI